MTALLHAAPPADPETDQPAWLTGAEPCGPQPRERLANRDLARGCVGPVDRARCTLDVALGVAVRPLLRDCRVLRLSGLRLLGLDQSFQVLNRMVRLTPNERSNQRQEQLPRQLEFDFA